MSESVCLSFPIPPSIAAAHVVIAVVVVALLCGLWPGLLGLFLTLREASVEVVEAIVAWRWAEVSAGKGPSPVFQWNGMDYLHKLCNDLDFLASCEPLVRS